MPFLLIPFMDSKQGEEGSEEKSYYENGQLHIHKFHRDGNIERHEWGENGHAISQICYRDGKMHGSCKFWHRSGVLSSHAVYKNGLLEGMRRVWYLNGVIDQRDFYQGGNMHGKCQLWRENGSRWLRQFYWNGDLEGESIMWRADGSVHSSHYYYNGKVNNKFAAEMKRYALYAREQARRSVIRTIDSFLIFDLAQQTEFS